MSAFRAFVIISRYEFMLGGAFFLMIVSVLATGSWQQMGEKALIIWLGIVMWYLSHMIASQVNCIADYQFDKVYKKHLSQSVDRLGEGRIWWYIWIESVLALTCTLYMTVLTGKKLLPVLWIIGWFISMGYSLEPFRFKRRGILNPLSLILVLYLLPMLYGYYALSDRINPNILILLGATGLQMLSLIILNELEDVPEDTLHEIETPFVKYGLWPVMPVVFSLFLVGTGISLFVFSSLIESTALRTTFLVVSSIGMTLIGKDIAALTATAWQVRYMEIQDQQKIRTLGQRNAMHFAALGFVICVGSVLSLY